MPQETVSDRVRQFIANTDVPEFTARNIADAIGVSAVNIVSAALCKLKSDGKITYRVIPHKDWGRPIHLYVNPRYSHTPQAPIVIPPRPIRIGRRELINPGCTGFVEGWIEKRLEVPSDTLFKGVQMKGLRFTSPEIAHDTGVNQNRVSALLTALRCNNRIRLAEKDGCKNIYFTTKKLFSKARRRKVPVVVFAAPVERQTPIVPISKPHSSFQLVDHLLEGAIDIEQHGLSRSICVDLIQRLAHALREI